MDWNIILTGVGTFLAMWAVFTRRFDKMEARIDTLEERIFLVATGKTLKEAMLEQVREKK